MSPTPQTYMTPHQRQLLAARMSTIGPGSSRPSDPVNSPNRALPSQGSRPGGIAPGVNPFQSAVVPGQDRGNLGGIENTRDRIGIDRIEADRTGGGSGGGQPPPPPGAPPRSSSPRGINQVGSGVGGDQSLRPDQGGIRPGDQSRRPDQGGIRGIGGGRGGADSGITPVGGGTGGGFDQSRRPDNAPDPRLPWNPGIPISPGGPLGSGTGGAVPKGPTDHPGFNTNPATPIGPAPNPTMPHHFPEGFDPSTIHPGFVPGEGRPIGPSVQHPIHPGMDGPPEAIPRGPGDAGPIGPAFDPTLDRTSTGEFAGMEDPVITEIKRITGGGDHDPIYPWDRPRPPERDTGISGGYPTLPDPIYPRDPRGIGDYPRDPDPVGPRDPYPRLPDPIHSDPPSTFDPRPPGDGLPWDVNEGLDPRVASNIDPQGLTDLSQHSRRSNQLRDRLLNQVGNYTPEEFRYGNNPVERGLQDKLLGLLNAPEGLDAVGRSQLADYQASSADKRSQLAEDLSGLGLLRTSGQAAGQFGRFDADIARGEAGIRGASQSRRDALIPEVQRLLEGQRSREFSESQYGDQQERAKVQSDLARQLGIEDVATSSLARDLAGTDVSGRDTFLEGQRQYESSFGEGQRRYDADFGENQRQFDVSTEEGRRQFDSSFGENQRQFDNTFGENMRQFDTSVKESRSKFGRSLGESRRQFDRGLTEDSRQFDESSDLAYEQLRVGESISDKDRNILHKQFKSSLGIQERYTNALIDEMQGDSTLTSAAQLLATTEADIDHYGTGRGLIELILSRIGDPTERNALRSAFMNGFENSLLEKGLDKEGLKELKKHYDTLWTSDGGAGA